MPLGEVERLSSGFHPSSYQAISVPTDGTPVRNLVPADPDAILRTKVETVTAHERTLAASQGGNDAIESAIRTCELADRGQSLLPDTLAQSRETGVSLQEHGLKDEEAEARRCATQCLRASRLMEADVRFAEITCADVYGGQDGTWDQHTELKNGREGTDRSAAALPTDRETNGFQDETLVVWASDLWGNYCIHYSHS